MSKMVTRVEYACDRCGAQASSAHPNVEPVDWGRVEYMGRRDTAKSTYGESETGALDMCRECYNLARDAMQPCTMGAMKSKT